MKNKYNFFFFNCWLNIHCRLTIDIFNAHRKLIKCNIFSSNITYIVRKVFIVKLCRRISILNAWMI